MSNAQDFLTTLLSIKFPSWRTFMKYLHLMWYYIFQVHAYLPCGVISFVNKQFVCNSYQAVNPFPAEAWLNTLQTFIQSTQIHHEQSMHWKLTDLLKLFAYWDY